MRTTIILMVSCLLLARTQAQTSTNAESLLTAAEAAKIASGLYVGMKESDADEYLLKHGLNGFDTNRTYNVLMQGNPNAKNEYEANMPVCVNVYTFYPLEGNSSLELIYYNPDTTNTWTKPTDWERQSILAAAEIQTNNYNYGGTISIKLPNPNKLELWYWTAS